MRTSAKQKYGLIAALIVVFSFVFYSAVFTNHTQAAAGTNQQLNYQGRLLDISGAVVADGLYNMEFKVYQDGNGCVSGGSAPCGGTLKWTETYIQTNRVTIKNGYFSVNLGSLTAFGTSVDWNQDTLWLSINIGGTANTPTPTWDGEMTQFKRLTSTPYALNSAQLGGLTAANFLQLAQGVQTDTSISNPSIFINKNNASLTPNIVQLQKAGSDVLVVDNGGALSVTPSVATSTIVLGSTAQTGTITLGQYSGTSTSIINIGANAGASSTQQVNIASSATGVSTLVLGSSSSTSTTTIRGGTGGININPSGSSNTGLIIAPTNNSTAAFQLQSASAADTLLTADTTNNRLIVGNATGTNGNTTQLIVDSATADPSSGSNGAMYYNSTTNKFRCYQNSAWADCISGTANSTATFTSGLANVAASSTGVAAETLVFTSATGVSNTAGVTGFTAPKSGSFRTCLVKNNAVITAGTFNLRWRVNGVSTGASACPMDSTTNRQSSTALDPGVVSFSQGDTIGVAVDTNAGFLPTGTNDFTVYWSVEYNSTTTSPSGATLQSAYDNNDTITTTDTHDLLVNAADTATDANVLFNLQCVTSCSTNGRFAVQNSATDVFTVNPNSGNIVLAPAGAGDSVFTTDADSNLQVNYTSATDATINIANISITDNAAASTGTLYGLAITNNDNGANVGVPDALAYLNNANAAETVTNGLLVDQTGAGTLTNGIRINRTAGTITNGLVFAGTGYTNYIDTPSSVFKVDGTGVVTAADVTCASTNCITLSTETTGNYVASANTSALTGLTGGSAGSEGAALTLGFDYSQALSGDVGLASNAAVFGQSGLVFEGSAADTSETFIAITNPTSDHTFTLPDVASGNICISNVACVSTSGTAGTFTGNYVASVATNGGLTGGAAASNAAALTLSIDQTASLTWTGTEAFNGATSFTPSGTNDVTFTLDADSFIIAGGDSINDFTGDGLAVSSGALQLRLDTTAADGSSTSSVSGLELVGGELSLIRGCAAGDVLKWDNTNFEWDCGVDAGAGGSPFGSSGGVITKSTSTDRLQLSVAEAGDYGLQINASVVPTADMLDITNSGQAVTTAGVSGLQISYFGGAAAVEASAQRIDLTGGTTAGGTWNGLQVVQGTITAGTTVQDIKLETAALTSTSGTSVINGLNLASAGAINSSTAGSIAWRGLSVTNANVTQGSGGNASATGLALTLGTITTGGTQYGLNITGSSSNAAGTQVGINIGDITSGGATETGLLIGTGWDNAIQANGNVAIGSRADSTAAGYTLTNSAAGTFGGEAAITGVSATAIYKGKLFAAVSKTDAAGVYRYDGGTTWTLVTGGTVGPTSPGKVLTGDTANVDSFVITVFNNQLVIGTKTGASVAAVFTSTNADTGTAATTTWTQINTTKGTFATGCTNACSTVIDGVDDIAVYNGMMFIISQETNAMEVYRYLGGTGASVFIKVSDIAGEILTADATDGDGGVFAVYGSRLYVGIKTGSTTGRVFYYDAAVADQTSAGTWVLVNTTRGTFTTGTTNEPDVVSMTVFNGSLWLATGRANLANIYRLKGGFGAPAGASPFQKMTSTSGKIISGDTANIDSIILRSYQGRLYAGTQTGAGTNTGAVYEFDTSLALGDNFNLIGTRGTFGAQTNIDDVTALQPMNIPGNGAYLYVGTNDSGNVGSVYDWYKFVSQSYALRLDSGSSNLGSIMFTADDQASDNNGRLGKFVFSHSVNFAGGAFDYAEDYPTFDSSLVAGYPVSVDPSHPDHVKLARPGETVLGIVSANPGMRLTSESAPTSGASWVPIALTGRVPVTVSGAVNPGDKLTLSDIPGVLVKADSGKNIIGSALSGHVGEGQGSVSMYVNPQWSDSGGAFVADAVAEAAGLKLTTGKDNNSAIFNIVGSDGQSVASIDSYGNATFAGTLTADKIKANQIEGIEILTDKISSLQAKIDKEKEAETSSSSASKSNNLNVTVLKAVDLSVLADIEAKGGLTVTKDALFNGKTIFALLAEFNGPVKFNGQVSYNNDAGGTAVIKKDSRKVAIKFSKEYSGVPIITANYLFKGSDTESDQETLQRLLDGGYTFIVSQPTTKGFSIILNKPATEDIHFTWLANLINNPQISQTQEPTSSSQ